MKKLAGVYIGQADDLNEALLFIKGAHATSIFSSFRGELINAASSFKLGFYGVDWAFKVDSIKDQSLLIVNYKDERKPWGFGYTGCPNNLKVLESSLRRLKDFARLFQDIDGIMLDAARFPSMAEGLNVFLSCFCPSCVVKAKRYGMDLLKMKASILKVLREFKSSPLKRASEVQALLQAPELQELLHFRALCIAEYVKEAYAAIKDVNSSLNVGLFLFPPSLSMFVGQEYDELKKHCDLISPMIYARGNNIACLDGEIAGLVRSLLKLNPSLDEGSVLDSVYRFLGFDRYSLPRRVNELTRKGLPPEIVGHEASLSLSLTHPHVLTAPIIMVQGANAKTAFQESLQVKNSGCDGVILFLYSRRKRETVRKALSPWL
jgi:hypothetical protein